MISYDTILPVIKERILQIAPDAKVSLFGSRAGGAPTDESDWDILVLTRQSVNAALKKDIHSLLFPLSVEIGAFINVLTIQENDWISNPSYYALRQTIAGTTVQA
jgi:predicted nucleotidyltransferase